MSAIDKLNALAKVKEQFEEDLKSQFATVIEELLTEHGARYVLFRGETPYFNDGDPCTHWSGSHLEYSDECYSHMHNFDWYTPTELEEVQEYSWKDPRTEVVKEQYQDLYDAVSHDIVDDMLELLHTTNFIALCGFDDDGKFRYEHQNYTDHD